ncbi:MAG: class I SAM-dependent methyltransferase [bacterium]
MKEKYLKYYREYSPFFPLKLTWDYLFEKSKLRKLSLLHQQNDYIALANKPALLKLHYEINSILWESSQKWENYDYGEGYFYQGCDLVGIQGLRDTRARVLSMDLKNRLKGLDILDIGCNSGFLDLIIADSAASITGLDINPYLIQIGKVTAKYLNISNVDLLASSFEDWALNNRFDAVLSFANHHTYDNLTKHSLETYFSKCASFLKPNGLFLFESHAPNFEGKNLNNVIDIIKQYFTIENSQILKYGSFLDTDRTFIQACRK